MAVWIDKENGGGGGVCCFALIETTYNKPDKQVFRRQGQVNCGQFDSL